MICTTGSMSVHVCIKSIKCITHVCVLMCMYVCVHSIVYTYVLPVHNCVPVSIDKIVVTLLGTIFLHSPCVVLVVSWSIL